MDHIQHFHRQPQQQREPLAAHAPIFEAQSPSHHCWTDRAKHVPSSCRRKSPFRQAEVFLKERAVNRGTQLPQATPDSPFKQALRPVNRVHPVVARAADSGGSRRCTRAGIETRKDFELAQLLAQGQSKASSPTRSSLHTSNTSSTNQLDTALNILNAKLPHTLALMTDLGPPAVLRRLGSDNSEQISSSTRADQEKSLSVCQKQSLQKSHEQMADCLSQSNTSIPSYFKAIAERSFSTMSPMLRDQKVLQIDATLATRCSIASRTSRNLLTSHMFDHDSAPEPSTPTPCVQYRLLRRSDAKIRGSGSARFNDLVARLRSLPSSAPHSHRQYQSPTPAASVLRRQLFANVQKGREQSIGGSMRMQGQSKYQALHEQGNQAKLTAGCAPDFETIGSAKDKFVTMSKRDRRVSRIAIPTCFQAC